MLCQIKDGEMHHHGRVAAIDGSEGMLIDTALGEGLASPIVAAAGCFLDFDAVAVNEVEMHDYGRVAAIGTLERLLVVASLAVWDAIPDVSAARIHFKLGMLLRMDGEDKVVSGIATAVRRSGVQGQRDAAVSNVLLAWVILGFKAQMILEGAVATGGPRGDSGFVGDCAEAEAFAFANLAFCLHLDAGGLVEVDGHMVAEGLTFFIGGGEGQRDGLVFKVLDAWSVDGVQDVVVVEVAVAIGDPKKAFIADGIGFQLSGHLADVLFGACITSKRDMSDREEDLVYPHMVGAAGAAAVFLVNPCEGVFALRNGEDHLAPVHVAAPLLYFGAVDIELEVVVAIAVGLPVETDFIDEVFHIVMDAKGGGLVMPYSARL